MAEKWAGAGSVNIKGWGGLSNKKALLFIVIAGAFLYYMLVIRRRK